MGNAIATAWNLAEGLATLKNESLECVVNTATPAAGIERLVVQGNELAGSLLSIGVGPKGDASLPPISEIYTRRGDLISVHEADPENSDWPVRTLLSWSVVPLTSVEGVLLMLTLSLQTDRLDVRPVVELRSSLGGRAHFTKDNATYAWLETEDSAAKRTACFIAPHPSDLSEATLMVESDVCRVHLAPAFLEKGVIRRCRVAACFLTDGQGDESNNEAALAAIAELAAQPLPLTT